MTPTRCTFAFCKRTDTAPLVCPTAIGTRIDVLCPEHTARRQAQNAALLAVWARLGVASRTKKGRRAA